MLSVDIQHAFDRNGNPSLVANAVPDGSIATPSWRICAPDCGVLVAGRNGLTPGPTAPGTTFQAEITVDGTTYSARSKPWLGTVTNTAPPTFTGAARVGDAPRPRGGTWTGGWGDDSSLVGLRACRTASGRHCVMLTTALDFPGQPRTLRLDPGYAGWYLGAIEAREPAEALFPAGGYPQPTGVSTIRQPPLGPTIAAGPLSQIAPDPGGYKSRPPRVTIRHRARRVSHDLDFGTIVNRPGFTVTVQLGRWTAIQATRPGRSAIHVTPDHLPKVSKLPVTVKVDGKTTLRRVVRLP